MSDVRISRIGAPSQKTMNKQEKQPPLGVVPKSIADLCRVRDLLAAMTRYTEGTAEHWRRSCMRGWSKELTNICDAYCLRPTKKTKKDDEEVVHGKEDELRSDFVDRLLTDKFSSMEKAEEAARRILVTLDK